MSKITHKMKTLFLMIKYYKEYKYWSAKKRGEKFEDYRRGPGYYLPIGAFYPNIIGQIWEADMQSGKIGIHQLVSYKCYSDPWDMIEYSSWDFVGYKGLKKIAECTFSEFLELYL